MARALNRPVFFAWILPFSSKILITGQKFCVFLRVLRVSPVPKGGLWVGFRSASTMQHFEKFLHNNAIKSWHPAKWFIFIGQWKIWKTMEEWKTMEDKSCKINLKISKDRLFFKIFRMELSGINYKMGFRWNYTACGNMIFA